MTAPLYAACIAAPRSGEGKTMVSMALMRLLTLRGMTVQAFKCGPDYIDPTFHSQATGRPSYNLDTWMMGADGVRALWSSRVLDTTRCVDAALCEGVMGLLDGKAVAQIQNGKAVAQIQNGKAVVQVKNGKAVAPMENGKAVADKKTPNQNLTTHNTKPFPIIGSTLDCARALKLPIILVVNARGMATSIAALVHGFVNMAQRYDTQIVGIIANNVGSPRHADMLRTALQLAKLPPLLGAIPRRADWSLPERQLGLVPQEELGEKSNLAWLDNMVAAMEPHLDIDALLEAIRIHRPEQESQLAVITDEKHSYTKQPKIMAIARDKAFCFYYEANLAALRTQGWELIEFSPLHDAQLPQPCDALYLGGGYPEEFANEIAANASMRQSIQDFAKQGGHIYAECGGYMTLAKSLIDKHGQVHEMYGIINAIARMGSRLKSLGYREFILQANTPFAQAGTTIRGHEFHWSDMEHHENYAPLYTHNGQGVGVAQGNILAGYGHLYWAHLPKNEQIHDDTQSHYGNVIIFNGPSSAGKSTLVALVQKKLHSLGFPTLSLSMDMFLRSTSCGHETAIEAMAHKDAVVQSLHGAVSAAAHAGTSVLLDHVLGEDDAWYADIVQRLDYTPYVIQVHCHLPELERRERLRNDRSPDLEHVRRQHASIHGTLPYAFSIDTSEASPEACADAVVQEISSYFSAR